MAAISSQRFQGCMHHIGSLVQEGSSVGLLSSPIDAILLLLHWKLFVSKPERFWMP